MSRSTKANNMETAKEIAKELYNLHEILIMNLEDNDHMFIDEEDHIGAVRVMIDQLEELQRDVSKLVIQSASLPLAMSDATRIVALHDAVEAILNEFKSWEGKDMPEEQWLELMQEIHDEINDDLKQLPWLYKKVA